MWVWLWKETTKTEELPNGNSSISNGYKLTNLDGSKRLMVEENLTMLWMTAKDVLRTEAVSVLKY